MSQRRTVFSAFRLAARAMTKFALTARRRGGTGPERSRSVTRNRAALLAFLLLGLAQMAIAGPQMRIGPYTVEITSQPGRLPETGRARLLFHVKLASGAPALGVTLRALTKMPGMNMGERKETAIPLPGQPGVYAAPAQFAMAGGYESAISIDGPAGSASGVISLATGQDLSTPAGSAQGGAMPPWAPVAAISALAIIIYAVARRRTGARSADLRRFVTGGGLAGVALLAVILAGAHYAVNNLRRPGAWTPLQAQGMEMNLPAPAGTLPVEIAAVRAGPLQATVRYSGQAAGYTDEPVAPRITGILTWMPLYVGDHVRRGQVVARLDTSQSAPQVAAQEGQVLVSREGAAVARRDYAQSLAMTAEADAEAASRTGAAEAARADVNAARQDRSSAEAMVEAARSAVTDAQAQVQAAQADQQYWREEMTRETQLLTAGAVTRDEFQKERDQAQTADSKLAQAQARVAQSQAQLRAAQAGAARADAQIASASAKLAQARSDIAAHHAHVRSSRAAAESAREKIALAEAGVQQAQAVLSGAQISRGYSEIRSQSDGVVTQRLISPGALVNAGQPILMVERISPIRLQANVAQADLAGIHTGSAVRVDTGSGAPVRASVTSIAPAIDPAARTALVEATYANPGARILPGQYLGLEISTGAGGSALRIPTAAIRYHTPPSGSAVSTQSRATVWVAAPAPGPPGLFSVHEAGISIGRSSADQTEVTSGLGAGELVVTAGQDGLQDGDVVTATAQDAPARGAANAAPKTRSRTPPTASGARRAQKYTCLMHPEIVRDRPGKCPKCGMDLLPVKSRGAQ